MDDLVSAGAAAGMIGAGLIGGTLFAFSAFIMAALKRLDDAEGVRAMQQINRTIYTSWFMALFFGMAAFSIGAIILGVLNTDRSWQAGMIAGGALYLLGVFLVTAAVNVPLNRALDGIDPAAPEAVEVWRRYVVLWTRWNHLRTLASIGSMAAFGLIA